MDGDEEEQNLPEENVRKCFISFYKKQKYRDRSLERLYMKK